MDTREIRKEITNIRRMAITTGVIRTAIHMAGEVSNRLCFVDCYTQEQIDKRDEAEKTLNKFMDLLCELSNDIYEDVLTKSGDVDDALREMEAK